MANLLLKGLTHAREIVTKGYVGAAGPTPSRPPLGRLFGAVRAKLMLIDASQSKVTDK